MKGVVRIALGLFTTAAAAWAVGPTTERHAALTEEQASALAALPEARVLALDAAGVPEFVAGRLGLLGAGAPEGAALRYLESLAPVFRATGREEFAVVKSERDELGKVHVRVQQYIDGRPVIGAELIVHSEEATGEVYAVNGRFAPDADLPRQPRLDARRAMVSAAREAGIDTGEVLDQPELVYVTTPEAKTYLAWVARIAYPDANGFERIDRVFADAFHGGLVGAEPLVHDALYRKIYTANYGSSLPGTLMFQEGGSSSDTTAMAAYNNLGTTYHYYKNRFNRDSYNNSGAQLIATVHYGSNYNNAYWNGSQMVFGDGDGTTFSPFAKAFDVVAHELTHAVTEYTANLTYQKESGALNEAMSDIMAAGAEAYKVGSVNSNTWKVGEDCYTPATSGDALRYMNNPTADGYSKDYYPERLYPDPCTPSQSNDYCGVHGNSGIANLAFYLLSQGGTHPRGKTSTSVSAITITKAEQIFYRALANYMTSSTNFQGARNATAQAAQDLYGATEVNATHAAWNAVGAPGGPVSIVTLTNGQTVTNQGASTGNWLYYKITVPSGQSQLVVKSWSGSGDADLYVKSGGTPTTSSYTARSTGSTSTETVTINNPAAGDWYIGLYAYSTFSGVSLQATYSGGGGGTMNETESNNTRSTANVVSTSGTTVTAKIGSSTDVDYFRVTVPGYATLNVVMTPPSTKDYDVKLYNSSGTLLASGTNGTGQVENVSWYNNSSSSKYVYIKVYGYNRAYSTTLTYTMKPTW